MKTLLKKLLTVLLTGITAVSAAATTTSCGKKADITVGILQVNTHDALDKAKNGFIDTLKDWAKSKGKTIAFDVKNAVGDTNNETSLAKSIVASKPDLVLGISTSSATKLANNTTKIPVLFTAVTDPSSVGLAGRANVTGTSDMNPVEAQIALLRKIVPDCKKIAFLYNPGEANSETQVKRAKAVCDEAGIKYADYTVDSASNVSAVAASVSGVDAVYIPTDNLLASNMSSVKSKITVDKKLPVIVGEEGLCAVGGLATVGINYYRLGVQTAEIAIKILEGKKTSDIPIENYQKETVVCVNEENARIVFGEDADEKIAAIKNFKPDTAA